MGNLSRVNLPKEPADSRSHPPDSKLHSATVDFASRGITFNNCYRSQPRAQQARVVNIILARISPGSKSTYPRLTLSFAGTIRVQSGARDSHLHPACAFSRRKQNRLSEIQKFHLRCRFFALKTSPWERAACWCSFSPN